MAKNGFTLIELCLVIFIIGLFSILAFPRLDIMLHYQSLSHINAQLLGFVRSVQRYAVIVGTDMTLCLDEIQEGSEWILFSTLDGSCDLDSSIRNSRFRSEYQLLARRYTASEIKTISEPEIVTFYALSGLSSANYRLVFEDVDLEQYVGVRITNIGAIKLCASEKALAVYNAQEVLACQ